MSERVVAAKAEAGAFSAISLRIGWRQSGENIPQTISAAGTPKSGLFETDPEREHDLRWFRAMWLSNATSSGAFLPPCALKPPHGHLRPSS
jgi:hypothetical protein